MAWASGAERGFEAQAVPAKRATVKAIRAAWPIHHGREDGHCALG
jgi:hypothetical protein